jgi:hypothetical protein
VLKHHIMKLYGDGGKAPRILNLGNSWKWVVSLTLRPLYPWGKKTWYPLDGRLGGPQSFSGFLHKGDSRRTEIWASGYLYYKKMCNVTFCNFKRFVPLSSLSLSLSHGRAREKERKTPDVTTRITNSKFVYFQSMKHWYQFFFLRTTYRQRLLIFFRLCKHYLALSQDWFVRFVGVCNGGMDT